MMIPDVVTVTAIFELPPVELATVIVHVPAFVGVTVACALGPFHVDAATVAIPLQVSLSLNAPVKDVCDAVNVSAAEAPV